MQPAQQHSQGRGRGSVTRVPAGEIDRAAAIVELLTKRRDFDYVRWNLWLRGYAIERRYWHAHLSECAATFDSYESQLRTLFDTDDDEAFDRAIGEAFQTPKANTAIRHARKALGRDRFNSFCADMIRIAAGEFDGLSSSPDPNDKDRQIAIRTLDIGFGLMRAKADRIGDIGPIISGDYAVIFQSLSMAFAEAPMTSVLSRLSDDELELAKSEWLGLGDVVHRGNKLLEFRYGKEAFGLRRAAQFLSVDAPPIQGMCILAWAAIRAKPELRGMADELLQLKPSLDAALDGASMHRV